MTRCSRSESTVLGYVPMNSTRIVISTIAASLICSCSKWPPNEQELRAYFLENQISIEALRRNLLDSKYFMVGTTFGNVAYANYFEGDPTSGESSQSERPLREEGWLLLFDSADVKEVHREFRSMRYTDEVLVNFPFYSERTGKLSRGMTQEDSEWSAAYFHSADAGLRLKECKAEFATALCGNCVVPIVGDWWIRYWWMPDDLTPESAEAWFDNGLANDEYFERAGQATDRCFADGGTLIEQSDRS